MNLPTDVQERMKVNRRLLTSLGVAQEAAQARLWGEAGSPCSLIQNDTKISVCGSLQKAVYAQDLMQIDVSNVTFRFSEDGPLILDSVTFQIPQGTLVSVMGPRGGGKATLLKLLANVLVSPEEGALMFTPPHLRVLQVSYQPLFFAANTITENICFGPSDGVDEEPERVLKICSRLGMTDELLSRIQSEFRAKQTSIEGTTSAVSLRKASTDAFGASGSNKRGAQSAALRTYAWLQEVHTHLMSHTDYCLINLARAFVMNPEMMIIHKPLAHFDALNSSRVLGLMREFVDLRGVENTSDEWSLQRPRTCIFSAVHLEGIELADQAFRVSDGSIQPIDLAMLKKLESQARDLFAILDEDGDEKVTRREFVQRGLRMPTGFWSSFLKVSDEKLYRDPGFLRESLEVAFDVLDVDNSDEICFDELRHFMLHKISGACPTTASTNTQAELGSVTLQISEEPLPPLAFEVVGSRVGRSRKSRWGKRWRRRTRRRWKRRRRELEGFGTGTPTPSNQLQSGGDYNPLPTASTSRKKQPQEPRHVRFLL
eukprot:gnl/TRDRNA2_/TRDRNA2_174544_c4_seq19.p1 gnl/TRDRNA2_/TRDRNA2_174544_c4~~gnl/TRDRNA2_/TRDRNA2_174544_c4_seq19.p1  ORF type:complete len:542 (+),score=68.43 gnl/TRDRNA2_/TRDRNA2_174544_c4_seq19:3-1628(+)